ncbi:preprotein translocase subunit YajC [Jeotgalibacillus soli]|uniref:Preprotein translocase subunit YajC n=1 Tax=Jeotgalibacillus soli TaxID=889306 RepID=A0A0C2VJ76_9BACL|nr:preprotein translocase subunit YajC [Jeotgalibacillus soli]KIL44531.1 preprotein translocase subunit YajC [Jeotgalibacillus soli]
METLVTLLPLILMFGLMYLFLIRPQQKRQKKVVEMQTGLAKGDKVVTIGGLHGIIDGIDEGKVILKCGDGTRLTFDRNAVREVLEKSL